MTGSRSSRGCAMKLSNGKVVSEEKEIKKRWHQYTENLYRRDINMNDNFNVHLYEDEPDVLEIEVNEAIHHISNRKSPCCDGIPIEFLKAGGDEAIRVMTHLCNSIWKIRHGQMIGRSPYMSLFTRKEIKKNVGIIELLP